MVVVVVVVAVVVGVAIVIVGVWGMCPVITSSCIFVVVVDTSLNVRVICICVFVL